MPFPILPPSLPRPQTQLGSLGSSHVHSFVCRAVHIIDCAAINPRAFRELYFLSDDFEAGFRVSAVVLAFGYRAVRSPINRTERGGTKTTSRAGPAHSNGSLKVLLIQLRALRARACAAKHGDGRVRAHTRVWGFVSLYGNRKLARARRELLV